VTHRENAMTIQILTGAVASTQRVLQNVPPGALGGKTPCSEWTVADLINHVVGTATFFADLAEDTGTEDGEAGDAAAGDFLAAFDHQTSRLLAAFSRPGVMDRVMMLPPGPEPGSVCSWVAAGEIFAHGWDLAAATGQDTALDWRIAEALLASPWRGLCDLVRSEPVPPIGPALEVPDAAPAADRLAGFLGRAKLA